MAAPLGPKKVHRYTVEFKIQTVRLSLHPEIQTQDVANALDIHPFMLSKWKKEYREGKVINVEPGKPPRVTIQLRERKVKLPDGGIAIMDSITLPVNGGFSVASDKNNRFRASVGKGDALVPAAVSYWQIKDAKQGIPQGRIVVFLNEGSIE